MLIGKVVEYKKDNGYKSYAKIVDKILINGTHKYITCDMDGTVKILLADRFVKVYEIDLSDLTHYDIQNKQ